MALRRIWILAQREVAAYFISPVAYAVAAIFLLTTGLAFSYGVFYEGGEASLRGLFSPWPYMQVILVALLPILTMRLLSEEHRSGTIETLMTAPISDADVVLGKYIGAFLFYVVLLLLLVPYAWVVSRFGPLDPWLLLCNFIGLLLLGGLFIAVGLFFSATTSHQLLADAASVTLLVLMTFLFPFLGQKMGDQFYGWPRIIFQQMSAQSHFGDFARGLVDVNAVVYFLTTAGAFVFFTIKILESRRWR